MAIKLNFQRKVFSSRSPELNLILRMTILAGFTLTSGCAIGGQPDNRLVPLANRFGVELYEETRHAEHGNFLISPLSIHSALSMAFVGSNGNTREQIAEVLNTDSLQGELGPLFFELMDSVGSQDDGDYRLNIANHMWIDDTFPVRASFRDYLSEYFLSGADNLDFSVPAAAKAINDWAAEATRGKIEKLVDTLDPATVLVIGNAVYFLGDWAHRFKSPSVERQKEQFFLTSTETVEVEMMGQARPRPLMYTGNSRYQAVELPYLSEEEPEVSMVIVLPRAIDGLEDIEAALSEGLLETLVNELEEEWVWVHMPRFTQRTRIGLAPHLRNMGMERAFEDAAEFSGISDVPVKISGVTHEAFIRVDEKGTEAAAVTGLEISVTSMPIHPPHKLFHADRPFLFFIRSIKTGAILFIGRVVLPKVDD